MIEENIISDIGKIMVFILTILSVYLFSAKSGRKLPNYLFAVFLILTAIDMTGYFTRTHIPEINAVKFALVLLQMPAFYLYVSAACYFNFRLKSIHLLHGTPFIFFVFLFISTNISNTSFDLFEIASSIQYYGYMAAILYTLIHFRKVYKANYSSTHEMTYKWLMSTTILFLIGNTLVLVRTHINPDSPFLFYMNVVTSLFALIVICWFVLSGLHNPNLFAGVDKNIGVLNDHQNLNDSEDDLNQFTKFIETEKPYLDDAITLQSLAAGYDISEKELSSMINKRFGKHFFDFINSYRIKDAKRLLKEQPDLTVLEILCKVGFNSKSSFYTAFKKETGDTPLNFRKSIV